MANAEKTTGTIPPTNNMANTGALNILIPSNTKLPKQRIELVKLMCLSGEYEETDDEFVNDHCTYRELVIKELYKRLVETGVYNLHIR